MRITKIKIRNLFGISEQSLDGRSVELTGPKGSGKTSVLDAIRYALTNRSGRDYIIHKGADEGEILIETDTGLSVDRKTRTNKADYVKVRDGSLTHTRPAEFLNEIFTPLQLNPVEFTQMSRQEKNRVILNLVDFDWDMEWINEQFGEIPPNVDYSKHILEVLADIQSERGSYYQSRQNINRDIRNNMALIEEIARDIPKEYDADRWDAFDLGEKYGELERLKDNNNKIARAKAFREAYDNKLRGLQAERDIALVAEEKRIDAERAGLGATIERLLAEVAAAKDKLAGLSDRLADKTKVIDAEYREKLAKLDSDTQVATEWADKSPVDVSELTDEVRVAETMKKHLNEYRRMRQKQAETDGLVSRATELTEKIEKARELPGEILKSAKMPIDGLTVEDGIPLINGLPISNRSDGELLELCVDIAAAKTGQLQIILIDGAEKLDTASREQLYARCREKGLQMIAGRTSDADTLEIVEL